MLGYRDSGMAGSEANANPASFAQAPLDEAVGRLVAVVRRTRPQVMVVYGDEQSGYPHPDHLRVHEIGLAGLPGRRRPGPVPRGRGSLAAAQALLHRFSAARFREIHEKFEELGLESPFDDAWRKRWEDDPRPAGHHVDRHRRLRRRPPRGAAGPRHPGRPDVALLVRAAPRGHAHHPSLRRLPAGPGGGRRRLPVPPRRRRARWRRGAVRDRPVRRRCRLAGRTGDGRWLSEDVVRDGVPGRVASTRCRRPARGSPAASSSEVTGGPDGDVSCYWVLGTDARSRASAGTVDAPT